MTNNSFDIVKFSADRNAETNGSEEQQVAFTEAVYHHAGAKSYKDWILSNKPAHELTGFTTSEERAAFFLSNHSLIMDFACEGSKLFGVDLVGFFNRMQVIDEYGNALIFPEETTTAVFIKAQTNNPMAVSLIDSYICAAVTGSAKIYRTWLMTRD